MIEERYFSSASDVKYKIILVGDPHVGKTTLFWKYIEGEFLSEKAVSITTIDFKIKEIRINGNPIKLYIWDTAGQDKYRSIVSTYFKGCDGVMLLFDLTSLSSFNSVTTKWYDLAKSKSPDAQLILVGNKVDLDTTLDQKLAQLWAKDHNALYVRISVKLDINVGECFRLLSEAIFRGPKAEKADSFALRKSQAREKQGKNCC